MEIGQEQATRAGAGGGSARWLIMMSLALFVLLLPISSYIAALSDIKGEWGLNNAGAGAVFSAFLTGYALSALLVIPLTDRLGPKRIFLGSAVISVVAHVLFPLVATGPVSGAILRAAAGVGMVGVYMPGLRLISERFATDGRGMAVGLFVSAQYAAFSASLAATGGLMARLAWDDAYLIMASFSIGSLPLLYLLVRRHQHAPVPDSSGRLDPSVLGNREARYFVLGYSLHAVVLFAVRVWLPAFLVTVLIARGVDETQAVARAATFGGLALAAGSFGPVMGGIISDRFGRAASAAAIFALSGGCSWLIGWTAEFPWAIIVGLAVVYGWATAADSAIYSTGVTEVVSRSRLGSAMAVQAFVGFMGGVIGPIIVGGILDASHDSYRWGFSFLGIVAIVAVAVLMRLRSFLGASTVAVSGVKPGVPD